MTKEKIELTQTENEENSGWPKAEDLRNFKKNDPDRMERLKEGFKIYAETVARELPLEQRPEFRIRPEDRGRLIY